MDSSFNEAVLRAMNHLALASKEEVGTTDVLAALFLARDPGLLAALRSSQLSRLGVLRYVCHGDSSREVDAPESLPNDDSLVVVMLNDHYTEMVVVVEILRKAFDMNVGTAYRTMMRVHRRGRAVLGPFPRGEALGRLERAIGILEQKQAPLKLIVAAPDDLPPAD